MSKLLKHKEYQRAFNTPRIRMQRQRGSIAVIALVSLVIVVAALGVIGVEMIMWQKRHVQSVVDLAALSAAQEVYADQTCSLASSVAANTAAANGFPTSGTLTTQCGYWQPAATPGGSFATAVSANTTLNAVRVSATMPTPCPFIAPSCNVSATATASNRKQAEFSLSSTLATLNPSIVNSLVGQLIGDPNFGANLTIADYQNLAGLSVNSSLLATELGAGSVDGLASVSTTVGGLANAELGALEEQGVASADLTLLQAFVGAVGTNGGPAIQLGNLFGVSTATGESAVGTYLDALDLLMVGSEAGYATISNGSNFLNLPLSVTIPGVTSVTAKVLLLQPPTLASGPPGTMAQSASGVIQLNVALFALGSIQANVTIAPSKATFTSCTPAPSSTFSVVPGALTATASVTLTALTLSLPEVDFASSSDPQAIYFNAANQGPQTVSMFTGGLLTAIVNALLSPINAVPLVGPLAASTLGSILSGTVTAPVDSVISSAASLLGLQLGEATVSVPPLTATPPLGVVCSNDLVQ